MDDVPLPYQVTQARDETADTVTLTLAPTGTGLLAPFTPGRYALVHALGVGTVPVPVSRIDRHEIALTIRSSDAVSAALCALRPGGRVGLRGPFGTGWELDRAVGHDLLVVAAGLGPAPLRPLVLDVLAAPQLYGHLNVLVGARTPDDILYAQQTHAWSAAHGPPHCAVTVDRPGPGWEGPVGAVTALLDGARFDPRNTTAYVCGPAGTVRETARALLARGLPAERVRVALDRPDSHDGHPDRGTGRRDGTSPGDVLSRDGGPVIGWDEVESATPTGRTDI
ncbi:oxidoreductase [Streptomyces sp. NPDC058108]|uniref:oxidoreductase n=1 Tax=Streptomyces sp. NPDC058108 TaxID=3346344 RepID=UPI0036EB9D73